MRQQSMIMHPGWVTPAETVVSQPELQAKTSIQKQQRYEAGPMELTCSANGLTDKEWQQIEAWVGNVIPVPGHCLQLLITMLIGSRQPVPTLTLRLKNEQYGVSSAQRSRVCWHKHNYHNQPVQLKIILRQIVRLS